ncbi:MAG: FAD-dependent monooxygenase [Sporichthyaceae bacterium]
MTTALVLGGSIAGLLAAAALSPSVDEVVVLERDDLAEVDGNRRGVPQGTQVHALLAAGQRGMETLLPGIARDFVAAGGRLLDSPHEIAIYGSQGWAGRMHSGLNVVFARRPVLETAIRRRVLALPNVRTETGIATGLLTDRRVRGVQTSSGNFAADLTVDTTGRNTKVVDWLTAAGYDAPATQELRSYVSYATATVELPPDVFPDGVAGIVSHPHPGALRGASVVPCDHGLFQISALGMMKADPAKDLDGFLAHLDAAPSPLIAEIARKATYVEPPVLYKVRGSLRRMWEDLERHPEGLLMLGDSVMSFNPLYGQGMSVAACEAVILRDLLAEHGVGDVAQRAQHGFREVVDTVFGIVVSVDSHYAGAELDGVEPPASESVAFGRALSQLATEDAEVALALKHAGHFFDTRALRSPAIAAKVDAWIAAGRTPAPQDPATVPPPLVGVHR